MVDEYREPSVRAAPVLNGSAMDKYDALQVYCPKLGHGVTFRYCRAMNNGLPCGQSIHCWYSQIAIQDYLTEHFSKDASRIFAPPKDKIETIVDLIEKSKKNR